ncbi:glycoside hydrolase family 32 protein [Fictibacillus aquaticus]|nr:sucrose-6-phosphate hydrolase [Fictibacillus aquaticus]
MTEREKELLAQAYAEIEKNRDIVENDPYRMNYHIMPPTGLINDPNGFIEWNGKYHLFYQWQPFKTGHGTKFWGHVSSTDLVHWEHEPIALAPSEWYEQDGCYSGSAVEQDGKLFLLYTGNVKEDDDRETYQCLAESSDGKTFKKHGPVLHLPKEYTAHFRDPKVWKKNDTWYMIIGAQTKKLEGRAVLFQSQDLKNWTRLGDVTGTNTDLIGEFGYMWECPDLFELGGKEVMVVSPQGVAPDGMLYHNEHQCGYLVGDLDYEEVKYRHGAFVEMDRGFEFYAPQTLVDAKGRRIMIAWMGMPDQYEQKHPTIPFKWIHSLTLPRELKLVGNKVYQVPLEEMKMLRGDGVSYAGAEMVNEEKQFDGVEGDVMELGLDDISGTFERLEITLRGNARFIYNKETKLATLERASFAHGQTESRHCYLEELNSLRIFVDKSSIEIFINEGEEVFSARQFAYPENKGYSFASKGYVSFDLNKWNLNKSAAAYQVQDERYA